MCDIQAGRGGGRDRQSGGGPRRFDGGRGSKAPPSRHLWIGNLSHGITEDELTRHFLNFGDLESVAFQPGRSYAFINFKMEEDARAAMEALNGFPVAGNPLRVEFTKAVSYFLLDAFYFLRCKFALCMRVFVYMTLFVEIEGNHSSLVSLSLSLRMLLLQQKK